MGRITADPHAIYETRMYRGLRSVIDWCVPLARGTVVMATIGVFALSIVGFGAVQQQFFPLSERPELFFQLRLPEALRSASPRSRSRRRKRC